jgi:hypothetical protein
MKKKLDPDLELRVQKLLIKNAATVEEADKLIEEYTPYRTTTEKLAWLYDNFDLGIVSREVGPKQDEESIYHDDYVCMLSALIHI